MIRKFGRIDAPPGLVLDMFLDVEEWPAWMPGVESVEILRRTSDVQLIRLRQVHMGRRFDQELECRIEPDGMTQKQLYGVFHRWHSRWRFAPPPDGVGTTVSCELEVELRVMGLPAPRRRLEGLVDRIFADIVARGQQRATDLRAASGPDSEPWPPLGDILLEVRAAGGRLEVRFGDRTFVIPETE